MKTSLPLDKAQFDEKVAQFEVLSRDWADRECTTFDEAVRRAAGLPQTSGGSIWKMPSIDSKRVVSLLVELEPIFGCRLPSALVRRGGYRNTEDLVNDLKQKIRERCRDSSAANSSPPGAEGELTAVGPTVSR
jgi:hypothetical protein